MHTPDEWNELIQVLKAHGATREALNMAVWARERGEAYPMGASAGWAEAIWRASEKWVRGHPILRSET